MRQYFLFEIGQHHLFSSVLFCLNIMLSADFTVFYSKTKYCGGK
ncbi:hypothetical protein MCC93_23150 [Morococcus cerebrosus]|uniref:Uncharacterized protein n=1 Tax=Morococcus cerebrosus TaxID=1056807 RepID=A0A0C1E3B2_9NEIS|nr:hypothetical protein MCC93_23150 [Morococcus cerebrosus]